jgi:hypothetical protein
MLVDLLGAGALSRDALVDALMDKGESASRSSLRDRVDELLQFDTSFSEVIDGVIYLPSVVDGSTWTVRVDADDAKHGFVRTHPDLSPLGWWLIADGVRLVDTDGRDLGPLTTDGLLLDDLDTDVVFGPDGWLDEIAGGWASVAVRGSTLCWSRCETPPAPTPAQVVAIRTGFQRVLREESDDVTPSPGELRFASSDRPVHEALLADRDAFVDHPIPPVRDLYRAAGLEERGHIVAEDGFNWDALHTWQTANRLRASYQLDDAQVAQLIAVVGACELSVDDGAAALGADHGEREGAARLLSAILDDGAVAAGFWSECEQRGVAVEAIAGFVALLNEYLESGRPVGLGWLLSRALDDAGEPEAAVAMLEAVGAAASDHRPALVDLAAFTADRGDAPGALRLLRRAGVTPNDHDFLPDDDAQRLLAEVEEIARHQPPPAARRNDPCPCGSGRKYKHCHLGRERHSLDDRASWLYAKAVRFLHTRHRGHGSSFASVIADTADDPSLYRELRDSPLVADLALHEDGVFAEFLAARDSLLPDDEALLAAQWSMVDRSVFEVERAERDRLELRDLASGDRITVVNVTPSPQTRKGSVLLGRPLPVGDVYRALSGFASVARASAAEYMAAIEARDATEIAELLGEAMRPPEMQNTDGHDLVLHTLRWRIADDAALGAALEGCGLRADSDSEWTLVRDSANRRNTIVMTLRYADGTLVGEVNSDERAAELLALVADALPGARLVDDDRRTFEEAVADRDPEAAEAAETLLDPDDPQVREVLDQIIAEQERSWLDESIPALGGRTPRAAAADPIGRELLEQLLDSFPRLPTRGAAVGMDPDRLRTALGL